MANESVRSKVVEELCDDLEAIVAGADYFYTPAQVFRWRTPNLGEIEFPSLAVFDLDEAVEVQNFALESNRLRVTIQGIALSHQDDKGDGTDDPARVARNLLADIRRAAVKKDTTTGGALYRLPLAARVFVDAPAEPYVVVELDLEILFRNRWGAPDVAVP